jgi:outer membrane protein assembly factor BamB
MRKVVPFVSLFVLAYFCCANSAFIGAGEFTGGGTSVSCVGINLSLGKVLTSLSGSIYPFEEVYFADANLETVVRSTLGIPEPTPITTNDMLLLTSLTASSKKISDLTGLEYASNLNYLSLSNNQISNISALSGLTNLVTLYLNDNQINNISALSGLPNLTNLYLYNNLISNPALSGLPNLMNLSLPYNQINDINTLSGFTNLSILYLYNNQISNISSLLALTNLSNLNIKNNQIKDISALAEHKKLNYLNLTGNPLDETAFEVYLPKIQYNNPYLNLYYSTSQNYALTIDKMGPGIVNPTSGTYQRAKVVYLAAVPEPNCIFYSWNGTDDDSLTSEWNTVLMDANKAVTGNFAPAITVDNPSVSEVWTSGSQHNIKWSDCNISSVDILFSKDGGDNWRYIAIDILNNGSFLWHLPSNIDSDNCLIIVLPSVPDENVICVPSEQFSIIPYTPDSLTESEWQTLGKNYKRDGLSDNAGPELGCVKWIFDTNGPVTKSVVVGDNGNIYIACEDGFLYAVDANGNLIWQYDVNSPLLGSPSIGLDGTIYLGGENGNLLAISKEGNLRWSFTSGDMFSASTAVSKDGKIFAGSMDGNLYALSSDGSELWTLETSGLGIGSKGSIVASPSIDANGLVYITGLYDPNLYALDPNNGSVKWKKIVKDYHPYDGNLPGSSVSPVIGNDGTIYIFFRDDPNLYAVESNNGSIKWKLNLADPCSTWFGPEFYNSVYAYTSNNKQYYRKGHWYRTECFSEPIIGQDGTIFVSFDDPYLRAIEPNGHIKWVTRLGMVGGFSMAISNNGLIYAASGDGYLYVVDSNGNELSRFIQDDILSYPVIAKDNSLILSDVNNRIWKISSGDCNEGRIELHRPQDISGDGLVSFYDIAIFSLNWLSCSDRYFGTRIDGLQTGNCNYLGEGIYFEGDVDKNLSVNVDDLIDIVNQWLRE